MSKKHVRSPKEIRRMTEDTEKTSRKVNRKNDWIRCQCTHPISSLRRLPSNGQDSNRMQCMNCGKIFSAERVSVEEATKSFAVIDRICDQLKATSRPGKDDEIVQGISEIQFHTHALESLYNDWTNQSIKRKNHRNEHDRNEQSGSYINTRVDKSPW